MDEPNPDWAPSLHLEHGREMNGNASSSRYDRPQLWLVRPWNVIGDFWQAFNISTLRRFHEFVFLKWLNAGFPFKYTRKRRRAEWAASPLKQLHENAHEGSSAVPDPPVTSKDNEPLFDDDPDIHEAPDQDALMEVLHGVNIATVFHFMLIFNLL